MSKTHLPSNEGFEWSVEEINLMCIYDTSSRFCLMDALIEAMDDYEDDELLELAVGIADKLSKMNDSDFSNLHLFPEYSDNDDYETEVIT
jgi:hypothetical protein